MEPLQRMGAVRMITADKNQVVRGTDIIQDSANNGSFAFKTSDLF